MPLGTPAGCPVARFLSQERAEIETLFAEGLVADLNAALVQQFLDIPMVVTMETVAVGFEVGYGPSAYPNPVKATQPFTALQGCTVSATRKYCQPKQICQHTKLDTL